MNVREPIKATDASGATVSPHSPGLALALCIVALLIFAFGVVAPLTPSHGVPSFWVLVVFVATPIAMVIIASRLFNWFVAKLFCYLEVAVIASCALYLVLLESGVLRS
jgi:hypothetical protein